MERLIRKSEGLFVALTVDGKNGNVLIETNGGKALRLTYFEFVSTVNETLDHWFLNHRHGIASKIPAMLKNVSFDRHALKDDHTVPLVLVGLTQRRLYLDNGTASLEEHTELHYNGLRITAEMPLYSFVSIALERFDIDPHLPPGGYGEAFHKQLRIGWRDMIERVRKLERKSA